MNPSALAGPRAAVLRREVGPVAWCALECLVERAGDDGTAAACVRSIATDLGVAKNTAHRAVAMLARAGLVEAIQERDHGGRFRAGRYRLNLADLVISPTPARARSRATPASDPAQLSLLG